MSQGTDKKTLKTAAKEAKQRLKNGFWQDFRSGLEGEVKRAKEQGKNTSKVIKYYTDKVGKDVKGDTAEEEAFYIKVKKILDEDGEVGDALGRLTDKEYYDSLSYEQKQRYTLTLSEKYQRALDRYRREKEYEK